MCFVAQNGDRFISVSCGNCDVQSALWAAGNYRLLLPAGCSDGPTVLKGFCVKQLYNYMRTSGNFEGCSVAVINTNIYFGYGELFEDEKYMRVINKTAIILL